MNYHICKENKALPTPTIYRTEDGWTFDDINDAVIHADVHAFNKYKEFGHIEKIWRSNDNGQTWN